MRMGGELLKNLQLGALGGIQESFPSLHLSLCMPVTFMECVYKKDIFTIVEQDNAGMFPNNCARQGKICEIRAKI